MYVYHLLLSNIIIFALALTYFHVIFILLASDTACFLGALQFVAGKAGKKDAVANAKIHTHVSLGVPEGFEGFGIGVDIKVEGVEDEVLIKAAHEVRCRSFEHNLPY